MLKLLFPLLIAFNVLSCGHVSRAPISVKDATLVLRTNVLQSDNMYIIVIALENRSAELPAWVNVEFGDCASSRNPLELTLVNGYGDPIEQAGYCRASNCTYSGPKYVLLKPGESFHREVRLCGISGEDAEVFGVDATYEDRVDTPSPPPEGSYVFRRRIRAQRNRYGKYRDFVLR